MSKFFVKENQINNDKIHILGEDVNHIANVLRMKKEDEVQICNQETGENYITKIISFSKDKIECEIVKKIIETVESNVDITLFQGIPKFDKMELIIQKNTEVGVKKIVPVLMERTVVKLDEKTANKKIERWQKIAEVAAKQSMRDIIPEIENIIKLQDITKQDYDEVLVAYENEEKNMLKQELKKLQGKDRYKIAIVIGPEGGISEKEREILKNMGASFVSLGKRILRTETAGIVMSGNIMYELED
ncbi:ribosomal RNA small subunit methyltransferase E [Clostridium sp. CAG:780]|nr:ribosomal RNA small subunit methyltransferase E [Clostridium sp. CAG:780]